MTCFLHAKTNITMTHDTGNKHTGKARERTVLSGKQCRDGMAGQGLEPMEERAPYLLPFPGQVPKGSISACRVSVIRRECVTLYYNTEVPWPSRLIPGPIMLYPSWKLH